ncbi:MAG: bifunctional riboflavin kinase/FAD synthetase [Chloroflexi bacterium]|nr:bifunctional riboflavin kinase/FAD synthetase [Chloroflexota bacterium]
MVHLRSLKQVKLDANSIVTIGVFDGVHLGHQSLIGRLVEQAKMSGCKSIVVTFHPHPDKVLNDASERYYLTTPDQRAQLILELGIDLVITLPFDAEFRRLPAADFVSQLLRRLHVKELWVGTDFALGFQREGDVSFLKAQGKKHGFEVIAVELLTDHKGDSLIRSSKVRDSVRRGDMRGATSMLGRPYVLTGKVVKGDQRGRTIGIPTANIAVWPEQIVPANGVYAAWAALSGETFMAATNIGYRPTFAGDAITIEAHLLEFNRDIYGADLELSFVQRLRPERKFDSRDDLIEQIQADVADTRQVLDPSPPV